VQDSPGSTLASLITQTLEVLRNTPPPSSAPGGNLLSPFPLESRTRILRFDLGAGSLAGTAGAQ